MYSANDIAKYVICHYRQNGILITNLKLQKLLYYIQGECISKIGDFCFSDEIQAWKHGPVVPSVYYTYNAYMASPILSKQQPSQEICEQVKSIINNVLEKYKDTDAWDLVDKTHQEYPWLSVYRDNVPNIVIPKKILKSYFGSDCNGRS